MREYPDHLQPEEALAPEPDPAKVRFERLKSEWAEKAAPLLAFVEGDDDCINDEEPPLVQSGFVGAAPQVQGRVPRSPHYAVGKIHLPCFEYGAVSVVCLLRRDSEHGDALQICIEPGNRFGEKRFFQWRLATDLLSKLQRSVMEEVDSVRITGLMLSGAVGSLDHSCRSELPNPEKLREGPFDEVRRYLQSVVSGVKWKNDGEIVHFSSASEVYLYASLLEFARTFRRHMLTLPTAEESGSGQVGSGYVRRYFFVRACDFIGNEDLLPNGARREDWLLLTFFAKESSRPGYLKEINVQIRVLPSKL